jgi:acid phosphatase
MLYSLVGRRAVFMVLACVLALSACASGATSQETADTPGATAALPRLDHVVVVVEENHGYGEVTGSADASYIASLAAQGAVFTNAHAVSHPSQPNYLALFAGSTFSVFGDACPQHLSGDNLASELQAQGLRFTGYSETMPQSGFTGCSSGGSVFDPLYARKHNPWSDFAALPAASNQPFSAFPSDFTQLPEVSFVVPNQQHDMHSGTIAAADAWLRDNLGAYAAWAPSHNSLLIVTWDEDDGSASNHILTVFAGAHVRVGSYAESISHYDVLRTIEALYGLSPTHQAASASTIADIWQA